MSRPTFATQLRVRHEFLLQLAVLTVGLHGLFLLASTLVEQLGFRNGLRISDIDVNVPLLIGLGLVYLSTLLRRRKRTAWIVALLAYTFMLGFYAMRIDSALAHHNIRELFEKLVLPLLILGLLGLNHKVFTVKSDVRSFGYSLRVSLLVLGIALVYGTTGFMLMDRHDFHQEINFGEAVHRTVDQFGLTSSTMLTPHTRRAHVFLDSLSVVSIGSVAYAVISLFQPIRARYTAQHDARSVVERLMADYPGKSEDFFKLWPHDKTYFFDQAGQAAIAYKVQRGVALVVGDPIGDRAAGARLLGQFQDVCYGNDWLPAYIHTEPDWSEVYTGHGYELQKLGEEAIVDLEHFITHVQGNKYFRQIRNKLGREQYSSDLLQPPHSPAVISRLRAVSEEWLQRPGRAERGFMLGYFNEAYLQQCPIVVARDSAGTIQAFVNQIPSYDTAEANFDMLRHTREAPGNVNDFVLMSFIAHLHAQGFARLNLGLSPLSGLDDSDDKSVINTALKFLYSNGDRFYSFSGLKRFKAKYEPDWSDRYLAYPGGARNFARIMNALNRAMKVRAPKQ